MTKEDMAKLKVGDGPMLVWLDPDAGKDAFHPVKVVSNDGETVVLRFWSRKHLLVLKAGSGAVVSHDGYMLFVRLKPQKSRPFPPRKATP